MSTLDFVVQFVLSVLASVAAVGIVLAIERQRRPALAFHIQPGERIHGDRKFLQVLVHNKPIGKVLGYFFRREPAFMCRARLTFLTQANELVFPPGMQMIGRWSSTPEPVQVVVVQGQLGTIRDPSRTRDYVDIAPGSSEPLDVVMRYRDKDACIGWHNEIIENRQSKPEHRFELGSGRHHVLVSVQTGGAEFHRVFRIVNDVPWDYFRLEDLPNQPQLADR